MNSIKRLSKEVRDARPSRFISILAISGVLSSYAEAGGECSSVATDLRYLWTAIAALAIAFVVHILIPIVRSLYETRRSRKHYFSYLWVNVDNTLGHYGHAEVTGSEYLSDPDHDLTRSDWHKVIKAANLEPPSLLVGLADKVLKAELGDDKDFIPFISYVGFQTVALDHEHPIWKLNSGVKTISTFLTTQAHCKEQIEYLYKEPFYTLITNTKDMAAETIKANKLRWLRGAEAIMADLAENYVAAVNLKNFLESQGIGK